MNNWLYLDNEKDLLNCLFDMERFEEIAMLVYKYNYETWHFSNEQFVKVIKKNELELILFFLKRRECRRVLDESEIQTIIVKQYIL